MDKEPRQRTERTDFTETEAQVLREAVRVAIADHAKSGIALAAKLFEAYYGTVKQKGADVPLAVYWGFDDFDDWAEHEVGLHETTARSYVRMYDELFVRRHFAQGILPNSIMKLRLLARISMRVHDSREMVKWITKARGLSCCDFEGDADDAFGLGSSKKKNISFNLKFSLIGPLYKALDAARDDFGVATKGEALAKIVDDWKVRRHAPATSRRRAAS